MPWKHEWVDPEFAFQVVVTKPSTKTKAASVWPYNVYHAYKDNNWNERLSYWYTLHDGDPANHPPHISNVDHTVFEFDIRTFPTYHEGMSHNYIMQLAIDRELCTIEDVMIYIQPINRGSDAQQ
jgi:hypothetical protein